MPSDHVENQRPQYNKFITHAISRGRVGEAFFKIQEVYWSPDLWLVLFPLECSAPSCGRYKYANSAKCQRIKFLPLSLYLYLCLYSLASLSYTHSLPLHFSLIFFDQILCNNTTMDVTTVVDHGIRSKKEILCILKLKKKKIKCMIKSINDIEILALVVDIASDRNAIGRCSNKAITCTSNLVECIDMCA